VISLAHSALMTPTNFVPALTMTHIHTTLARIARAMLGIETLETRSSDRLDFHEVSVASLRAALEAAYHAGAEQARKAATRKASAR
jgi:hypothetical protein